MSKSALYKALVSAGAPEAEAQAAVDDLPCIQDFATKADLDDLKAATKADMEAGLARLEATTKEDMAQLKAFIAADMETGLARLEAATKEDIAWLEATTKEDMTRLKAFTKADLEAGLARLEARLIRWVVGSWLTGIGVIVAIILLTALQLLDT